MPVVEPGDRLLVVHRRLFEKDDNRFFVGEVEAYGSGIIRVTGFTFVRDVFGGRVKRKEEPRTKLLSITSGTLLVYVLPRGIDCNTVEIVSDESELRLVGGNGFAMNLSEWTQRT